MAATSSPNSAAPGLRTMSATSTPANSQGPFRSPWKPGRTAPTGPEIGFWTTPQTQKTTPDATATTLATTMSTTRQRRVRGRAPTEEIVACTVRALSVEWNRARDVRWPPCAGMTQIRFDGRDLEKSPLSPAHRTPVFGPILDRRGPAAQTKAGCYFLSARMTRAHA